MPDHRPTDDKALRQETIRYKLQEIQQQEPKVHTKALFLRTSESVLRRADQMGADNYAEVFLARQVA